MKIQVIANCQARPISGLIPRVAPDVEALEPIIVHLAKAEDEAAHLTQIAQADVIFAQLTQDQFQPAHLATKNLKEWFGDKVVVWPNIFYMGQQPYLRYFTHPQLGRLMGPLEALHDIRPYRSWKDTGCVDPAVLDQSDSDFIAAARAASMKELQAKEADCDIGISDFLQTHEGTQRLFYTFNHPLQFVLSEVLRRLLDHLGKTDTLPLGDGAPEPLDRFQVPSVWSAADAVFQGDSFAIDADNSVLRPGGPPQPYTRTQLCEGFQLAYDANDIYRTFDGVRLTPNLQADQTYLTA
ncbi:MAG: hypothetical protein ACI8Z0_000064 [Lentimonas sp.]|jgi:hypothetical protein